MTRDDPKITALIKAGDAHGFRILYERYAARIFGYLARLTGRQSDAEDLLQDVFVAAYNGRDSFNGRSSVLTWLLGIASRRWRDSRRRAFTETTGLTECAAEQSSVWSPPGDRPLDVQIVDEITLSQALLHLEPEFQEALLLVASQGLTYREAAEVTGEPIGTVKWRVFEATRKIRKILKAIEEESNDVQTA